ncbi:glycosyltransferase [Sphingomonas aracearum]|uniref:Glycosyltransferase n=1 Tax=Sphingomonas aracearum TaxID=2283317 RepID=A0A369VSM3_9SPHN|nr:glycosyltransferase [Sphingomonas aracearum]RDE04537.1 glycosyltransferase [Sphingomonas aracearum]
MAADHILTLAQSFRGGGVERAMLRLAGGWAAAGRRVTLLVGDRAGPLAAEVPPGIELRVLGDPGYRHLAMAVRRAGMDLRPDVLFCPGTHYTSAAALARLGRGGAGVPVVAKISNTLDRTDLGWAARQANRAWMRLQPRWIDRFVAMTEASARDARHWLGVAPERVSVIANPPARPIAGAVLPPLPEAGFILGVGRLEPQKRWDRLIAAVPRLADPSAELVILGEGSLRAALEEQVAALGLGGRVRLPGHVADPSPAFASAAVLALTSDFEGVPGVLREALAAGTPVVTTDSSVAIPEIVAVPALGSIVPRGDGAALVAALDRWLVPDAVRPAPVAPPGADAVAEYLALFDALAR